MTLGEHTKENILSNLKLLLHTHIKPKAIAITTDTTYQ